MALEIVAIVLAVTVVTLAIIYRYMTSTFGYFEKRGIPGPKPCLVFGNWWGIWNKFQGEQDLTNIREFGQVYGTFDGRTPTMVVADPTLVKAVLGREAASFRDRRACNVQDPVLRQSLLALGKNEKQDPTKTTMPTTTFLVHEKLRAITPLFLKAADNLTDNLKLTAGESEGKVDISKQVANFLTNVLALAVFGLDLEKSTDLKVQFLKFCEQVFFNANSDSALSLIPFLYPSVTPLDGFIMSKEGLKFFKKLCKSTIEERRNAVKTESTEPKIKDFVDLCVEAAEEEQTSLGKLKVDAEAETTPPTPTPTPTLTPTLTDERLVAECLAVIINTSLVTRKLVSLSVHTLAAKPEAQDKLVAELANQSQPQGELSYETIQGAKYLNMFIDEIERMYPSEFRLERDCCDSMEIDKYKIERGCVVAIPVFAIHHQQDFYPEPEKFDPERFSPENVEKRVVGTYLPYGHLGSTPVNMSVQFGVLAAKMAVASLAKSMKFSPAEETQIPPAFELGMTAVLRPRNITLIAEART